MPRSKHLPPLRRTCDNCDAKGTQGEGFRPVRVGKDTLWACSDKCEQQITTTETAPPDGAQENK